MAWSYFTIIILLTFTLLINSLLLIREISKIRNFNDTSLLKIYSLNVTSIVLNLIGVLIASILIFTSMITELNESWVYNITMILIFILLTTSILSFTSIHNQTLLFNDIILSYSIGLSVIVISILNIII